MQCNRLDVAGGYSLCEAILSTLLREASAGQLCKHYRAVLCGTRLSPRFRRGLTQIDPGLIDLVPNEAPVAGEFGKELHGSGRTLGHRDLLQERSQDRLAVEALLQYQGGYNTVKVYIVCGDSLFRIEAS